MWIEITYADFDQAMANTSLPLRECGLKSKVWADENSEVKVTPFAGVWIEMIVIARLSFALLGHSLCGSVD